MNKLKNLGKLFSRPKFFSGQEAEKPAEKLAEKPANIKQPISAKVSDSTQENVTDKTNEKDQKEKFYVTKGPHLYISKILLNKGPMTPKEIWLAYTKDTEARQQNLIRSITHLRHQILPSMKRSDKLSSAGYSVAQKKHLGLNLHVENAFKNVHPDILQRYEDKIPERLKRKIEKFRNAENNASSK